MSIISHMSERAYDTTTGALDPEVNPDENHSEIQGTLTDEGDKRYSDNYGDEEFEEPTNGDTPKSIADNKPSVNEDSKKGDDGIPASKEDHCNVSDITTGVSPSVKAESHSEEREVSHSSKSSSQSSRCSLSSNSHAVPNEIDGSQLTSAPEVNPDENHSESAMCAPVPDVRDVSESTVGLGTCAQEVVIQGTLTDEGDKRYSDNYGDEEFEEPTNDDTPKSIADNKPSVNEDSKKGDDGIPASKEDHCNVSDITTGVLPSVKAESPSFNTVDTPELSYCDSESGSTSLSVSVSRSVASSTDTGRVTHSIYSSDGVEKQDCLKNGVADVTNFSFVGGKSKLDDYLRSEVVETGLKFYENCQSSVFNAQRDNIEPVMSRSSYDNLRQTYVKTVVPLPPSESRKGLRHRRKYNSPSKIEDRNFYKQRKRAAVDAEIAATIAPTIVLPPGEMDSVVQRLSRARRRLPAIIGASQRMSSSKCCDECLRRQKCVGSVQNQKYFLRGTEMQIGNVNDREIPVYDHFSDEHLVRFWHRRRILSAQKHIKHEGCKSRSFIPVETREKETADESHYDAKDDNRSFTVACNSVTNSSSNPPATDKSIIPTEKRTTNRMTQRESIKNVLKDPLTSPLFRRKSLLHAHLPTKSSTKRTNMTTRSSSSPKFPLISRSIDEQEKLKSLTERNEDVSRCSPTRCCVCSGGYPGIGISSSRFGSSTQKSATQTFPKKTERCPVRCTGSGLSSRCDKDFTEKNMNKLVSVPFSKQKMPPKASTKSIPATPPTYRVNSPSVWHRQRRHELKLLRLRNIYAQLAADPDIEGGKPTCVSEGSTGNNDTKNCNATSVNNADSNANKAEDIAHDSTPGVVIHKSEGSQLTSAPEVNPDENHSESAMCAPVPDVRDVSESTVGLGTCAQEVVIQGTLTDEGDKRYSDNYGDEEFEEPTNDDTPKSIADNKPSVNEEFDNEL